MTTDFAIQYAQGDLNARLLRIICMFRRKWMQVYTMFKETCMQDSLGPYACSVGNECKTIPELPVQHVQGDLHARLLRPTVFACSVGNECKTMPELHVSRFKEIWMQDCLEPYACSGGNECKTISELAVHIVCLFIPISREKMSVWKAAIEAIACPEGKWMHEGLQ
jgi:hypothetical protein